ncbi:MAG: orotate phosphoribosyltransferase-like protein [Euryarchaeota archaeon]|nr:orotate phosphoribosyltransferase-like protein [Euryarchaeota archaeon]MBR96658.1 orotate phosphoribosyltransferase-like protein [Euryarchaeota archaeon]|tara:strand:- start:14308 stop:14892 length:585 start_codon:yes stop_codon:yes gene_type:complete
MVVSIEELRITAANLRKDGLNSQQIADELSLSQDTISWLLAGSKSDDRPTDVRIGWRTIGVKPNRIAAVGTIMADVADEELGFENIDTAVGISINGITFAHEVARNLDCEFTVYRTTDGGDGSGSLSNKYGQVAGKKIIIIDDVLSTGKTMSKTINSIRGAGGEVGLVIVLVNKTMRNEIEGVPLRGVIRAVSV